MTNRKPHKLSWLLIFLIIFLSTCSSSTANPIPNPSVDFTAIAATNTASEAKTESAPTTSITVTAEITPTAYLPVVNRPSEKFLGVYLQQYWTTDNVDQYMSQADQQTGKKHTSVGWFIDLQNIAFTDRQTEINTNNFYRQLDALWNKGYISFVNLGSTYEASAWDVGDNCPIAFSLNQIITGECDSAIQKMADLYYQWLALGGGRRAMIAPLQEMNGVWISYGEEPNTSEEYKIAYRHILDIFTQRGITRDQIWWVFAPNAYNDPGDYAREFENYYPGDNVVDIVGFSSYNYGYCPQINPDWWTWERYPKIFEPYVVRMQAMAPSKPIIIAETASSAFFGVDGNGNPIHNPGKMNEWLVETYDYLAKRDGVIGVFYFSFKSFGVLDGCEIEINPGGQMLSGYTTAASNAVYQYLTANQLSELIR